MMQIAGLIRETFLEAISKKVMIGFFVISSLVLIGLALYFFSSSASDTIAHLQPTPDDPNGVALRELVYSVEMGIGGAFFYAAIFFSIFVAANTIPSIMERGTIDLLLSKPLSRTKLLLGKILGGFVVAAVNIVFFILASWIIISAATGIWNVGYLLSLAPALLGFISLYSVLVFIGVTTQSSALGMIVCYLLASVISGLLFSREEFLFPLITSETWRSVISFFYYILPQMADLNQMSSDMIQNRTIEHMYPVVNASGFAAVFFALSILVFRKKEF